MSADACQLLLLRTVNRRRTFASKLKMFAKRREESWKKENKAFWLRLAEDWAKPISRR
jgi:hypothetical protein